MFASEYNEWVSSAHERYLAAKKLLEKASKDPPNEPYRSKYAAREIFTQIETELENKWKSNPILQVKLLSTLLNYELGVIAIETEEKTTGCDLLTSNLEVIKDLVEKPECCLLALSILNQLGVLWSERGETEKALHYLLEAETLYLKYKTENETCPFVFEDIFLMENSGKSTWVEFEKKFTYTAYFLAQVYGHMEEIEKSAKYCGETLRRQKESDEFVNIDWVRNCYTLSQFYIVKKLYQDARHLMSCATHVLSKYEIKMEELEENEDALTQIHQNRASLSGCFIRYAIALLSDSQNDEDKDIEQFCRLLEDEEVVAIENQIPYRIKCYEDAKKLFIFAQNQVTVAQSFFKLNEYASNYAQITQDHSKLYKALAAVDPDLSRQCKMHKRRYDMLEKLLSQLNPTFYLSICRQLLFELGEICMEMVDLKSRKCGNELTLEAGIKINLFSTKGIDHFSKFLDTFKDKKGNLPKVFSDDVVRPVLICHFYIAKFFKIIDCISDQKVHNVEMIMKNYGFVLKYVEKNPQHTRYVEKELPLIKEMLELLSEKYLNPKSASYMAENR